MLSPFNSSRWPTSTVRRYSVDVVDNLWPYNGQDSFNETNAADDELPEEHVTRDDVPEESTLPTPDVSWDELPGTDALRSDADLPKRCRRRPRTWMTTCSLILGSFLLILLCFVIFFCSSFTVNFFIWGY